MESAAPEDLWKRVKQGNVKAEVSLAKFYLEGDTGSRNCEQARLLLTAASKNRSKVAEAVLSGTYAEHCQ